ncbi:hypothetical protein [Herbidospora daliensis]|uniref:hypothetical protein n=1 Tax=Herbidospora daliensis TaxID=295585 RepID=UPI000A40EAEB|nr:hypothetical protein [Herbidospora daliensis]
MGRTRDRRGGPDLYKRDLVVVAAAGDRVVALQVGGWWFAFDGELNEVTATAGRPSR